MEKTVTRKAIVYGTGNDGKECLDMFGKDNILFFVSDVLQADNRFFECDVLSLAQFKAYFEALSAEEQSNADIILAVHKINIHGYLSLSARMEEMGCNYSIWHDVRKRWSSGNAFLARNTESYPHERESLYLIHSAQLSYLCKHVNPAMIGCANGEFREAQISMVKNSAELFSRVEDEEIKPAMCGGTLIGALRHKGFIPWDDDLDFALLYPAYTAMIDKLEQMDDVRVFYHEGYTEENNKVLPVLRTKNGESYRKDDKIRFFARVGFGYLKLYSNTEEAASLMKNKSVCDVFPLYYFNDSYTDEQYHEDIAYFYHERKTRLAEIDKNYAAEMKRKGHITDESPNIGYGHSHIASLFHWYPGSFRTWKMCSASHFLPLEKREFEGHVFWAPANPDKFLAMVGYQNWQVLPSSLPFDHHDKYLSKKAKSLEEAVYSVISRKG